MIAAGTHTARERGRAIALWAAALSTGNVISPVARGLVVRLAWGSDPHASWRWAFIVVERGRRAPLLRLDLFANRAYAVTGIVTVAGMFAMLGTAYSTSIRLSRSRASRRPL